MSGKTILASQNRENEILLIDMARYILHHKKLIIILTTAVMFLVSVKVFLEPNRYSSTASLLPSGKINKTSKLSSMIGLGISNINDENSSQLYPTILSSRLIQEAILARSYNFDDQNRKVTMTLPEYFKTDNRDRQRQALGSITKIKTDRETGCIYLAVETEYPGLSQAVLSAYLSELEKYNLYKRNSQGQRNAAYLEKQIAEVKSELTKAENELEKYRLANQSWVNTTDPTIIKESSRLGRQVATLSHSYLNLLDQYEIARQDALNDIPIVAVLDQSSLPTIKSGPFRKITVLLFGAATFFITVFVLLAKAVYLHKIKIEDDIYYKSLTEDIKQSVSGTKQIFKIIKNRKSKEQTTAEPQDNVLEISQ